MNLKSFLTGYAVGSTRNQTPNNNHRRTEPGTGDPQGLRIVSGIGAIFFAVLGAPFAFLYFCGLTILAPLLWLFGGGLVLALGLYIFAERLCR